MTKRVLTLLFMITLAVALTALDPPPAHATETSATDAPPGEEKTAKTKVLETKAKALQANAPLAPFDIYLVGFHPMKEKPQQQMIAHHYCHQVNEDFAQCLLFDGNKDTAKLNSIEYIVSEKLFASLPEQERSYWHPHNGEILSGQLVAPGIPDAAEESLMRSKMNSYGKTWHVWNTGHPGHEADSLPLGPAMLAWSFSRDGEILPELVEHRDKQLDVSTEATRERRQALRELAQPQHGVDALKGKFDRPTREIPGVVSK